ncbi:MAG: helix-turn-helix domain-containing protein [Zavarzinella sp.]
MTLSESAEYLRVTEDAVLELVENGSLPAQQIGGEWRFLKRSLVDFLRFGPQLAQDFKKFPSLWMLEHPFWNDLIAALEHRMRSLSEPKQSSKVPGSNQAILKHFGVFKEDGDLIEQLAQLQVWREAASE